MQPRVKAHLAKLDDLIARLKEYIKLKLVGEIDVGDAAEMSAVLDDASGGDLTLARIADAVEKTHEAEPIDREWLKHVTDLVARLQDLRWRYENGKTGKGRSSMGFLNATGCTSVWGSTYPFNPYPFPWANHLFQDPASMAMGVFEGHMVKMAEGFKAVRMAEEVLKGETNPEEQVERYRYFGWKEFTDDEYHLCPPVVAVGGDGAMYDIGFQNLSRALMSGKPIKVLVVDTQVYSNTGGQACTSGFVGQVSDMAQFGKAIKGKEEIRKEMGLIAMAHRTTYFLQSTIAHSNHMIEGFVEGLMSRNPALFNLYSSCQPEHGIGDDMSHHQARLAVESRAYPLFKYDPERGETVGECLDLDGNPNPDLDWPVAKIEFVDEQGREQTMELSTTFVDFAVTEARFRKHFRKIPRDSWNDDMVQVSEYLELDADDRAGKVPFVWALDAKRQLSRLLVADAMIESAEERRAFWIMLRDLGGIEEPAADEVQIETRVRQEVVQQLTSRLMGLVSGSEALDMSAMLGTVPSAPSPQQKPQLKAVETVAPAAEGEYMAPWIDTEDCTECDECILINPSIFEYNADKKAIIKNPDGGPYRDLVKAAEKCTAEVIHPGLPRDRSAKDIDKWIKRGEKFN